MEQVDQDLVRALLQRRWVTLACTNADGTALASEVALAWLPGTPGALLHLSTLAKHTRNMLERDRVSVSISEDDDGRDDPQTLARISLKGSVHMVARDSENYADMRAAYLSVLPLAEPRFDFGDFNLFHLTVESAQYVGGFARAFRVKPDEISVLTASS